jgi:ATP-dependent DNA helicase RecG
LDRNKLKQLLKREEGPKLDFKATLSLSTESDKKELTKDVIAMANSRGGRGYIIFGVEDKTKKILGIDPGDFSEEQIQQIICSRCDPPVPVSVEFVNVGEKVIAIISVYRSSHKPHQMIQNGAFYIRRGSTTGVARRSEIANMFQENGLMSFETVILKNAGMDELVDSLIKQYFANLGVVDDAPKQTLMEAMGIIGQDMECEDMHPTIGGLLLFGKNPSIFLPHVYIKVSCNSETRCFYGNILNMLDDATEYIGLKLNNPNYPLDAVSEVIANAIAHRDYLDNSRGITVTITNKNIEVSNPGSLIAGNSVYNFMRESNPIRRNPWLYQRLLTLDTKKRFLKSGMGLTRIKKALAEIGEVKYLNIGSQNLFKVILPR